MNYIKLMCLSLSLFMLAGCGTTVGHPTQAAERPTENPTEATNGTATQWPNPDKMIALTFDDGPSTETMVQVLDLLKQYDAKATFFLIGKKINASTTPVLQRAVDEGHELANHSMNHLKMAELSDAEIIAEYTNCQRAVKDAVGVDMYYFRPPFGSLDDRMYQLIESPFIGAAVTCGDGTIGSIAADRAYKTLSGVYDGAITLMHCFQGNSETVEALAMVLPELKAQGYQFVTLSELYTLAGYDIPAAIPGAKYRDNKPLE